MPDLESHLVLWMLPAGPVFLFLGLSGLVEDVSARIVLVLLGAVCMIVPTRYLIVAKRSQHE